MSNENIDFDLAQWPYQKDLLRGRLLTLMQDAQTNGKLNLSRLEGITVAEDLTAALKAFDPGHKSNHAAAMRETLAGRTITTLRSEGIRAHIFFPVDAALQIFEPGARLHHLYSYMFIHECAHVHDLDQRVAVMPEEILNQPLSQPLSVCVQVSWNEYAACRLAAYFYPDALQEFKTTLQQAIERLGNARAETKSVFAPTQEGKQKAIRTAFKTVVPFLQSFSYILGHCRGLGVPLLGNAPEGYNVLRQTTEVGEALHRLENELDRLWDTYGAWQGFRAFDQLIESICAVVRATTGLSLTRAPEQGLIVSL